jgi:ribosomal protein S18 acetylase RimI-like enzyme
MLVRSLAYGTDLLFPRFDGEVIDHGDYLVVRTPTNPHFYWGNFLLFPSAPTPADLEGWPALIAREFPDADHLALGWDDAADGVAAEFVARGYTDCDDAVMTATQNAPRRLTRGFEVRPLRSDADWAAHAALNEACDERTGSSAAYDGFKRALRARYRAMVADDHGRWLGAFAGDTLLGALGVFVDAAEPSRCRLQSVETHPEHRGRGVCSALTAAAIATGLGELGCGLVVVVVDHASQAERIYRRAGFRAVSRQRGTYYRPTR